MLKRLFPLALMIAALFGLGAQGVARAGVPLQPVEASAPAMNSVECMEKMAQSPADDHGGCSLADCIAAVMAGCSTALIAPQPTAEMPTPAVVQLLTPATSQALTGRSQPPDPRPPSVLI